MFNSDSPCMRVCCIIDCYLLWQVTCHVAASLMTIKSSRVLETPHGKPVKIATQKLGSYVLSCSDQSFLSCSLCPAVHCGTLRQVSRPQSSPATAVTSWVCLCLLISAPLCLEPVTPRSNCGTSETACVGRPSRATSQTSMPSVWVCSGQRRPCNYTTGCKIGSFSLI